MLNEVFERELAVSCDDDFRVLYLAEDALFVAEKHTHVQAALGAGNSVTALTQSEVLYLIVTQDTADGLTCLPLILRPSSRESPHYDHIVLSNGG